MKTLSRKEFLKLLAASGAAAAVMPTASRQVFAQTENFFTVAEDRTWVHRGAPQLFGATGLALATAKLITEGITRISVLKSPRPGPYVEAWMLGGHVASATYRKASVELTLDGVGIGYHFVELYLGDLYPFDFFDATGVTVDGPIAPGARSMVHAVPRLATLNLPVVTLRIQATFGGRPLSGFNLELPHFRSIQG